MSRAPHTTIAHMVRDELRGMPGCRGDCQQSRRQCATPKVCCAFVDEHASALYSHTHRVTPVQPDDGLTPLHVLESILLTVDVWLMGLIAVCCVAGAGLIVYIIVSMMELAEVAAKAGAL